MSRRRGVVVLVALLAVAVTVVVILAVTMVAGTGGSDRHGRGGALPSGGVTPPGTATAPGSPPVSPAPTTTPGGSPSVGGPTTADRWRPGLGLTWQWQLTGTVDTSVPADVYDLDGVTTSAETVAALHRAGRKVICYLNAGAWEGFRADSDRYPAPVQGRALEGWPNEKWLDIRRWDLLEPVLSARLAECRDKGFDGVEPDNVDAYANDSGFPLTAADQLTYNRRLADLAHRHGLAVGLKNDVEQVPQLVAFFDFAVNEECARYDECDGLRAFTAAGKPVFHVEYDVAVEKFCGPAKELGFSSMRKRLDLDAWRQPC